MKTWRFILIVVQKFAKSLYTIYFSAVLYLQSSFNIRKAYRSCHDLLVLNSTITNLQKLLFSNILTIFTDTDSKRIFLQNIE